jgi:beta-glucosidase
MAQIDLEPASFEFYNYNKRQMTVTPGEYEVYYGNSSNSKDLKVMTITIN